MKGQDKANVTDSVTARIIRGNGKEEIIEIKGISETPLDELVKTKTGESLESYMIKMWNAFINALGKKFLSPPRWAMKAVIEIEGDSICQGCLFYEENKNCIIGDKLITAQEDFLCAKFIPTINGLKHLWKWMAQGRVIP